MPARQGPGRSPIAQQLVAPLTRPAVTVAGTIVPRAATGSPSNRRLDPLSRRRQMPTAIGSSTARSAMITPS